MPPLRVLSIATLFPDASRPTFGIFVEQSLRALAARPDIDLTIAAPLGLPPGPLALHPHYAARRRLPREEQWHGLRVLRPRWTVWPGIGAARNGPAIARAVLRAVNGLPPFDVIDAQFFHPDAVAAQQVARALGLPYSVKGRGSDIQYWANRADTGPAIRAAAAAAGGVLAVSMALRDAMVATGMDGGKVHVHRTGIDAAQFRVTDQAAARAHWALGDGPVLLTVGTLNANKGQRLVIDALAQLPGVTYLIAGTGPERSTLSAQAEAAGVADRVRFLDAVPHADMAALYSAADIMVLPSQNEGLANAWVEAMACGTPIITADIAPALEVIDHPDNGRIAAREPSAIAAAVRDLLAHPPDRAALSARTHARHDWEHHAAELAAHLRAVAGKAGNGSGGGT